MDTSVSTYSRLPLGASFADWFGKPPRIGHGLGYGDGLVTVVLTIAIVGLVAVVPRRERRTAGLLGD